MKYRVVEQQIGESIWYNVERYEGRFLFFFEKWVEFATYTRKEDAVNLVSRLVSKNADVTILKHY